MNPRFLAALLDRTGRSTDTINLLTVATPLPGAPPLPLREIADSDHPRVRSAGSAGTRCAPGRPTAGSSSSVAEWRAAGRQRSRWTSRSATAAWVGRWPSPHVTSYQRGEPVWSQQAAGNARSVRAFQAAGFRPVGAEAILLPLRTT